VIATGPWGQPYVPAALQGLGSGTEVLSSSRYRNPAALPAGGVLVVGSSASGVQIADELARAGRKVVVAVGRHARSPRRYRGMDIYWWLERTGRLGRTIDQVRDPVAARREPSMQLIGRNEPDRHAQDLDLRSLQHRGVRLVGHLAAATGSRMTFADDAEATVRDADLRMHRLLDGIDRHIDATGLSQEVGPAHRPLPVEVGPVPREIDLKAEGIGSVVLATGFRPHHPWLRLPITGPDGAIVQQRGVTPAPGVYVVGQRFQHRRDSGLIDGARHDARMVVDELLECSERTLSSLEWS
jgi:putative flavoprotein involved in K+ transport